MEGTNAMTNIKKIMFLTVAGSFLVTLPIATAWHRPIHPYDHVFDAKRFADSVKETAEMVNTVQNTYEKLRQQGLINAGVNLEDFINSYNSVADSINGMTTGNTIINVNTDHTKQKSYKTLPYLDAIKDKGHYQSELLTEATDRKRTALKAVVDVQQRTTERQQVISNINASSTNGALADLQKANAIDAIEATNNIDAIRQKAIMMVDEIQSQEEQLAHERLEQQKATLGTFYTYDPYNPTEQDKEQAPESTKNLGFLKFGK